MVSPFAWAGGNIHWPLLVEVFSNPVHISHSILVSQTSFSIALCLQNFTRCSIQQDGPSPWISCFSVLQWCIILQRTHVGWVTVLTMSVFVFNQADLVPPSEPALRQRRQSIGLNVYFLYWLAPFPLHSRQTASPLFSDSKQYIPLACGMPKLTPGQQSNRKQRAFC